MIAYKTFRSNRPHTKIDYYKTSSKCSSFNLLGGHKNDEEDPCSDHLDYNLRDGHHLLMPSTHHFKRSRQLLGIMLPIRV